jgi:hypothetical protein
MSRLKKSKDKRLTLPLLRWGPPGDAGAFKVRPAMRVFRTALRYWIPSSPMPWSTLGEPGRSHPAPPNQAVLGKRIDGVLAAGWNEATRWRSQRRHHVAVQLDHKDQCPRGGLAHPSDSRAQPRRLTHRSVPARSKARRKPLRSCCSSHADDTCRLLGSARITT